MKPMRILNLMTLSLYVDLLMENTPNYEAVIPKENPNVLTIDRVEFYNSIRRVGILLANQPTKFA